MKKNRARISKLNRAVGAVFLSFVLIFSQIPFSFGTGSTQSENASQAAMLQQATEEIESVAVAPKDDGVETSAPDDEAATQEGSAADEAATQATDASSTEAAANASDQAAASNAETTNTTNQEASSAQKTPIEVALDLDANVTLTATDAGAATNVVFTSADASFKAAADQDLEFVVSVAAGY